MEITLNISDELADHIRQLEDQLPEVFERGVRCFQTETQTLFNNASDIIEILAKLPDPEEILKIRPSEKLQNRINVLLEKNRTIGLLPEEEQEWMQYEYLEHIVRLAKGNAAQKRRAQ